MSSDDDLVGVRVEYDGAFPVIRVPAGTPTITPQLVRLADDGEPLNAWVARTSVPEADPRS